MSTVLELDPVPTLISRVRAELSDAFRPDRSLRCRSRTAPMSARPRRAFAGPRGTRFLDRFFQTVVEVAVAE